MKAILFVDDEAKVLQGIQRLLYAYRKEWNLIFADNGARALEILDETPVDIVVTDMLMPGMDGAQLLNEVRRRHPQIMRIILSGHSDQEAILKFAGPAHQFLSKPCTADVLQTTLHRALALQALLGQEQLRNLVSQFDSLPSLPDLYLELREELRSANPSLDRAGAILERDPSMCAKILQLANSAYFGLAEPVANPLEAANFLGIETIQALVLTLQIFNQFEKSEMTEFVLENLWNHCWSTGVIARRIATAESQDPQFVELCFISGLLHDIGKLVLIRDLPERYKSVLDTTRKLKTTLAHGEQEVFGASHAELGAYLLGLWGIPNAVVESVAFHHRPAEHCASRLSIALTVHVANAFDHARHTLDPEHPECQINQEALQASGLAGRLLVWREQCWPK